MGRYRLVRRLAVGGMAEVFLAKVVGAEGFEKPVAVKRMLPSLAADPQFVELFLREAKLTVSLQHANVVQVFDLGSVGRQYYLVMEFVDGENLREILREAQKRGVAIGIKESCHIVQQVAAALAYAHGRTDSAGRPLGIIHRDVNPSNVMIARSGEVKLADFGIAKAADGHAGTQAGVVKGKAGYIAPEQIAGKPADQRSDLFLLGLLLHELLSGRRLFEAPNYFQALQQITAFDPAELPQLPGIPTELWEIVIKALAPDPARRFQRARDVAEALDAFLFEQRLRVGPQDLAALFARVLPDRRSVLEGPADAKVGEEIRIGTPAGGVPLAALPIKQVPRQQAIEPRREAPPPKPEKHVKGSLRRKPLGEIFLAKGRITEAQLAALLARQKKQGGRLGEYLVGEGLVEESELVKALSEQTGIPFISDAKLQRMPIPRDLLELLPREKAERLVALPVTMRGKELYCALLDPRNLAIVDELKFITGVPVVNGIYATEGAIRRGLRRFYLGEEAEAAPWEPAVEPAPAPVAVQASLGRERVFDRVSLRDDAAELAEPTRADRAEAVAPAEATVASPSRQGPADPTQPPELPPLEELPPLVDLPPLAELPPAVVEEPPPATPQGPRVSLELLEGVEVLDLSQLEFAPESSTLGAPQPPPILEGLGVALRLHERILELVLAPLGGGAAQAIRMGQLARAVAIRLGAPAGEVERAGAAATMLGVAAHLEGNEPFSWPSGPGLAAALGALGPLVGDMMGAGDDAARTPAGLAVSAAAAFAARAPEASSSSDAAAALRGITETLPPSVAEALAAEVAERLADFGAPVVVVAEPDVSRALPLLAALLGTGLRPRLVRSGRDAVGAADGASAIVLPPVLPDLAGVDLVRALRTEPGLSRLPIVFLAGHDDTSAVDAGADELLPLGSAPEEIVTRVRELLEARKAAAGA